MSSSKPASKKMRDEACKELDEILKKIPVIVGHYDENGHYVLPKEEYWDY
jgi:hypothetical protein